MTEPITTTVYIEKPAKRSGGDRYTGRLNDEDWQVYLPQSLTRFGTLPPQQAFVITITDPPEEED